MANKKYISGGRIYEDSGRNLKVGAVGGGVLQEDGSWLFILESDVVWAGQSASLTLNAAVQVTEATEAWAGQLTSLSLNAAAQITAATEAWAGQSVTMGAVRPLVASNAGVTWAGQSVSMTLNAAVTASNAGVTWAGQATTMTLNTAVVASNAAVTWAGQEVTLTYAVSNLLEVYKSGGHVIIEASAGPSYVLDALVATNVGDDITITDNLTGLQIISGRNYDDFRQNGGAVHGATAAATVTALNLEFVT